MSNLKLAALTGSALALTLLAASPALAQSQTSDSRTSGQSEESNEASGQIQGETVLPGRIGGGRRDREQQRQRGRQPAPPTPEEILAAATTATATAAPGCQVTEANLLGQRETGAKLYEVACATGPGYIVEAAETPVASDCVLQSSLAWQLRRENPEAEVGLQCSLPANQDRVRVISEYAASAGVSCNADEAVALSSRVYELGCAGTDGFRLERADSGGWTATPCWRHSLISTTGCWLTTEEENSTEWPKLVANTEIAACNIEGVSWMGDNPTRGEFYELKCSTGEGVIVRFKDGATQQVYSCVDAMQIFSKPCSLTGEAAIEPEAVPAD